MMLGVMTRKELFELHYDDKVVNRLKRIEGQIKGVLRMIEEGKDCKEVVTQLSASRSAIDRTIGVIVSSNIITCIQNADANNQMTQEDIVKEAVELLVKSR